jgi:hypothetical protein
LELKSNLPTRDGRLDPWHSGSSFGDYERPVAFVQYGASTFAESNGAMLPTGLHEFPLVSVSAAEEFPSILQRFDEDLWNLAGFDTQRTAPNFSLVLG